MKAGAAGLLEVAGTGIRPQGSRHGGASASHGTHVQHGEGSARRSSHAAEQDEHIPRLPVGMVMDCDMPARSSHAPAPMRLVSLYGRHGRVRNVVPAGRRAFGTAACTASPTACVSNAVITITMGILSLRNILPSCPLEDPMCPFPQAHPSTRRCNSIASPAPPPQARCLVRKQRAPSGAPRWRTNPGAWRIRRPALVVNVDDHDHVAFVLVFSGWRSVISHCMWTLWSPLRNVQPVEVGAVGLESLWGRFPVPSSQVLSCCLPPSRARTDPTFNSVVMLIPQKKMKTSPHFPRGWSRTAIIPGGSPRKMWHW